MVPTDPSGSRPNGTNPGPRSYVSNDEESELADFLLEYAKIGYGKTRRYIKCIVESYLQKSKCKMMKQWVVGKISQKKSSASLRAGDATSNVRMDALSKTNLDYYFGLLKME